MHSHSGRQVRRWTQALARAACGLLALLTSCQTTATPPAPEADWSVGTSRRGRFVVEWRSAPSPIPFNEPFELEVRLRRSDEVETPWVDAPLSVQALMPGHGHGMLRGTRSSALGDGEYRIEGMLFHMEGLWEIVFQVQDDEGADRAVFEVRLE